MKTFTFTIPEKYEHKKRMINQTINKLKGDFDCHETKDGSVYNVDFEDEKNGTEFKIFLSEFIPDIFEY